MVLQTNTMTWETSDEMSPQASGGVVKLPQILPRLSGTFNQFPSCHGITYNSTKRRKCLILDKSGLQ